MLLGQKRPNVASETFKNSLPIDPWDWIITWTLSSFLLKVQRTKNISHYEFFFLVFLFMLSSFKIYWFLNAVNLQGKGQRVIFQSRNHFFCHKCFIARTNNHVFQIQFALKKIDIVFFISRIWTFMVPRNAHRYNSTLEDTQQLRNLITGPTWEEKKWKRN